MKLLVVAAVMTAVVVAATTCGVSEADDTGVPPIFSTVLDVAAWKAAVKAGVPYAPPDFGKLGFIHCSRLNQTAWVLNRFYSANMTAPTAIIRTASVIAPIKMIHSVPGKSAFPHIFGKLNLDAVVRVVDLNRTSNELWTQADVCKQLGGC